MNEVTRRDAVKLAAAGVVAAGVSALGAGSATAQDKRQPAIGGGAGRKIDGIKLPANLGASLGGTPEEAATAFKKAVTIGMAQVMADALAAAVTDTVGGGGMPDWAKLIKGPIVNATWDTAAKKPIQAVVSRAKSGQDMALGGGSVEVSIRGTF
ncbi:MAG TPA: hypothetical protein VGF55_09560 [Gemmataceae bacterium]|jgi:hypothetical protein